jgi:hypothetical protein
MGCSSSTLVDPTSLTIQPNPMVAVPPSGNRVHKTYQIVLGVKRILDKLFILMDAALICYNGKQMRREALKNAIYERVAMMNISCHGNLANEVIVVKETIKSRLDVPIQKRKAGDYEVEVTIFAHFNSNSLLEIDATQTAVTVLVDGEKKHRKMEIWNGTPPDMHEIHEMMAIMSPIGPTCPQSIEDLVNLLEHIKID